MGDNTGQDLRDFFDAWTPDSVSPHGIGNAFWGTLGRAWNGGPKPDAAAADPRVGTGSGGPPQATGAQSGAGNNYLSEAGILTPQGGTSGKSAYGLGALASVAVVGSPVPVDSPQPTAEQVVAALAHADPGTIAQLQSYLFKGGFYDSGARWQDINLGVIRPDDIKAFSGAVGVAAQTGADLGEYIRRQAAWGVYTGATSPNGTTRPGGASAASTTGQVLTIEKPDPKRIGQIVDEEFKKLLGHKPSAHERAGFIAAYSNAYQQAQIDNYQRQQAAVTGGVGGADPLSGSSAPPPLEPEAPGAGDVGENIRFAEAAGGPHTLLGMLTPGLPNPLTDQAVANYNVHDRNQQRIAQDQAFLSLADQPLPGMPGFSSGTAGGASSSVNTVVQQEAYDPQAFADEWIDQHHTAEAGAHSVTDVFSSFLNILRSGMQ